MKNRLALLVMDIAYLVTLIVCSLFYLLGNFGKALPARMGLAQLIFSLAVAMAYIFKNVYESSKLSVVLYVSFPGAVCRVILLDTIFMGLV